MISKAITDEEGCNIFISKQYYSMSEKKLELDKGEYMKICFTASSGGHLEEITRLIPIAEKTESFLVTEKSGEIKSAWGDRTYYLRQINRKEPWFIFHFTKLFFQAWKILRNEKPDFIISTGALITYPFCLISKWRKVKIIYIESFARVDEPSLTGKLMYPIADLFLVQWEEMKTFYPNAIFAGGVF